MASAERDPNCALLDERIASISVHKRSNAPIRNRFGKQFRAFGTGVELAVEDLAKQAKAYFDQIPGTLTFYTGEMNAHGGIVYEAVVMYRVITCGGTTER